MQIGIQSNVWGPEYHKEKRDQMLAEIAKAGYAGIEIGAHRFANLDDPISFLADVQAHGLHVAGIHTLGKLYLEQVLAGDLDYPTRAAGFTQAVESDYMLYSGDPAENKSEQDFQKLATVLNRTGELCQARGITFCYHNHWWEIQDEQRELRAIRDLTDPALVSLCLDIGWVERAGYSPVAVTQEFMDRIRYFHFKDTRDDKFTELGQGTVDFQSVLAFLEGKENFYITHERDEILPNAFESARQSRQYLEQLGI